MLHLLLSFHLEQMCSDMCGSRKVDAGGPGEEGGGGVWGGLSHLKGEACID